MKFKIVAVGKIKEKFFKEALDEYAKRISRFAELQIVEVDECFFQGVPNSADVERIKNAEGEKILKHLEGNVVVMAIEGKMLGSVELSAYVEKAKQTNSTVCFVIGGSYGVADQVKKTANLLLSFGKITFPHQLFRVVLAEQIYRATTIANNVNYHK